MQVGAVLGVEGVGRIEYAEITNDRSVLNVGAPTVPDNLWVVEVSGTGSVATERPVDVLEHLLDA